MSQSRPQNSLSNEPEQVQISDNESIEEGFQQTNKARQRSLGRPKSRGRPKVNQRLINRKKASEQQIEVEQPKPKQRVSIGKQENQIQPYVRIVDYLKKIDCDEASFQNKMNPFHCLTSTCFWYMVSAEYYSHDFFHRNNPSESANQILNRVSRLPIQMPTRFIKNTRQGLPLEFQTEQVKRLGQNFGQVLNNLIPLPSSSNRTQNIEKKMSLTSVAEDNEFISSTRALLFNYVKGKIQKSEKWSASLKGRLQIMSELEPKQITVRRPIGFQSKLEIIDASQLDILSRQVKKRKSDKKTDKVSEPLLENGQNSNDNENCEQENSSGVKSLNENLEQNLRLEDGRMDEQEQKRNPQENEYEKEQESSNSQSQLEKKALKPMTSDQVLLSSILSLPLQKTISILQASIPKPSLPAIYPTFMPIPKSDPLDFVFQLHQQEQKYLEYMKEYKKKVYHHKVKRSENLIEEEERETQFQDAKCQICTDGDYTDDNLIVFCSTCNISLHQRCVGLAKVPAQSWVCDVCLAFGPAGINLPCPLCNVRGGAMKRTNIHIDSNLFKQTNPSYYEYSKRCPYNKQKQEYLHPTHNPNEPKQELYYDYFNKSSYPTQQPSCHYVWVHYVCSIWVPECYFEQKNGAINVKGIENIEKKRFKHECFACKKTKAGACVKCQEPQCRKYYHPECARKKKVYMEQLNLQKIKYLVFCQEHQPLKITRQIEYKKKKSRDEIIKFARMIEKYIETYKIAIFPFKLMKIIPTKSFIQTFECEQKQEEEQKKPEVIQQTDEDFIKEIIIKLSKVKKISVTVVKTETGLKIVDVNQPSRRQMRKCLNRYDDFWHTIQNGQNAEENCKRYDRIMKENAFLKDKMETFLNGGSLAGSAKQLKQKSKKGKARGKGAKQAVETLVQQEGGIFCICRKPYQNELDMIECEICGQWYHYKCLGFIGNQVDAQTLQFHCMKCMKFQSEEEKKPRLEKCIHLFASDSLYLNYSPPTPKLSSEQDQIEVKEPLVLQNYSQSVKQSNSVPDNKSESKSDGKVMEVISQQNNAQNGQQAHQPSKEKVVIKIPSKQVNLSQKQAVKPETSEPKRDSVKKISIKQSKKQKQKIPPSQEQNQRQQQEAIVIEQDSNHQNHEIQAEAQAIESPKKDIPSMKQQQKMQTTLTQFISQAKSKRSKNPLSTPTKNNSSNHLTTPNSNLSVKQKLAELQRSIKNKEYK